MKKLFLMLWCPDSAKIKKKMLYSSSFDAIKKALVGVQKYIQVQVQIHFDQTFLYFSTSRIDPINQVRCTAKTAGFYSKIQSFVA